VKQLVWLPSLSSPSVSICSWTPALSHTVSNALFSGFDEGFVMTICEVFWFGRTPITGENDNHLASRIPKAFWIPLCPSRRVALTIRSGMTVIGSLLAWCNGGYAYLDDANRINLLLQSYFSCQAREVPAKKSYIIEAIQKLCGDGCAIERVSIASRV